jgi:RNA polymerase sigma-70 factor (ECF subfamily)
MQIETTARPKPHTPAVESAPVASPESVWPSTLTLLTRARDGDRSALDELFGRHLSSLRRWARGRLPPWARDLGDTQDLVQDTLFETFKRVDGFEHRGQGALQAYLRQAILNRIRNELKRAGRRPAATHLDPNLPDSSQSPLEAAIGTEAMERYDAALARMCDDDRALVIARLELDLSYADVAESTGRPTANAARMAVSRALVRLAEAMRDERRLAR